MSWDSIEESSKKVERDGRGRDTMVQKRSEAAVKVHPSRRDGKKASEVVLNRRLQSATGDVESP